MRTAVREKMNKPKLFLDMDNVLVDTLLILNAIDMGGETVPSQIKFLAFFEICHRFQAQLTRLISCVTITSCISCRQRLGKMRVLGKIS